MNAPRQKSNVRLLLPLVPFLLLGALALEVTAAPPAQARPRGGLREGLLKGVLLAVGPSCAADESEQGLTLPTEVWNEQSREWVTTPVSFGPCPLSPHDWAQALTVAASALTPDLRESDPSNLDRFIDEHRDFWPATVTVSSESQERFEQVFGAPLVSSVLIGKGGELPQYNPRALDAVFHALDLRPDDSTLKNISAQVLYDTLVRRDAAAWAAVFQVWSQHRSLMESMAKVYADRVRSDENFAGADFARQFATLLPLEGDDEDANAETGGMEYPERLGTLLRRQIDGTLPLLTSEFKNVLKRFDHATYVRCQAASW